MRLLLGGVICAVLLSCGGASATSSQELTDEQFARKLLTDWLVRRDLAAVRPRLAPDFFLHPALRAPEGWPSSLHSLPERERALRLPFACENAPARCATLSDCAKAMEGAGDFQLEHVKIDADMIRANPDIRPRAGHDALLVSIILKGCNLGTSLIVDKTDGRKVVTIFYIAG